MSVVKPKKTTKSKTVFHEGVGRRKSATCRVRLYVTNTTITVRGMQIEKNSTTINGKGISEYFPGRIMKIRYERPFQLIDSIGRFAVVAVTSGGGLSGQLDAYVLACARALQKVDATYRSILKKDGLLTVDARVRERRKAGLAQKARKEKQSPKR